MALLKLENIEKTYENGHKALKDINLEVNEKEFLVLLGPSGCGKSTLLRMIAGLIDISSGSIYIEEECVNQKSSKDRDISMVFQNYALYPHMNVFDNMAFGLKMRKYKKADIKKLVTDTAEVVGIGELLYRRPSTLSGGQKQRVAIGRALVRKPKLFLMDEPLSNLDAKLRIAMRLELAKLHKNLEETFVYVTHDQIEAMSLGTKIVVMDNGVIQQIGSPEEIYNSPKNLFVAEFIGQSQMNIFEADISMEKESFVEVLGEKIKISDIQKEALQLKGISRAYVGIRPEDISINYNENTSIIGKVLHKEMLGAEYFVEVKLKEGAVKVIINKKELKEEILSEIKLNIENRYLHFFDIESKERII